MRYKARTSSRATDRLATLTLTTIALLCLAVALPAGAETGKFAGIRGTLRTLGTAEPKAGVNDNQYDIDYWIEK
jgi:hypothetical protein